jgi:hypothetical protein
VVVDVELALLLADALLTGAVLLTGVTFLFVWLAMYRVLFASLFAFFCADFSDSFTLVETGGVRGATTFSGNFLLQLFLTFVLFAGIPDVLELDAE